MDRLRDGVPEEARPRRQRNRLTIPSTYQPQEHSPTAASVLAALNELTTRGRESTPLAMLQEHLRSQLLHFKEKFAKDYEAKLDKEIKMLTASSDAQLDKWADVVTEELRREIQALQDSNKVTEKSRDDALMHVQNLEQIYHEALMQIKEIQCNESSRFANLQSELKIREFEIEHRTCLLSELQEKYNKALLENDKLSEKLNATKEQLTEFQINSEKCVSILRMKIQEKSKQLAEYEKLETFIDEAVLRAAEIDGDVDDVELKLSTFGTGIIIPSNSKARLRQSIQLAAKVMELECKGVEMKSKLFQEINDKENIRKQLNCARLVMKNAGTPTQELIELIWKRDYELIKKGDTIDSLQKEVDQLRKENLELTEKVNRHNARKKEAKKVLRQKTKSSEIGHSTNRVKAGNGFIHYKKPLTPFSASKVNQFKVTGSQSDTRTKIMKKDTRSTK